MQKPKPRLIIIGGSNGSGKTSIKDALLENPWTKGCAYLNPDDFALNKFGGYTEEGFKKTQIYTTELTYKHLKARKSMVLETAFSSERKGQLIADALKAGFFIRLYFIGTDSPTINASRVCARMMKGGHEVYLRDIISRHKKSVQMCKDVATLVDRLYVFDNSVDKKRPTELFRTRDGYFSKIMDPVLEHQWSKDMITEIAAKLIEAQNAVIEEMASAIH